MIDPMVDDLLAGVPLHGWRHPSGWHLGFTVWELKEISEGRFPTRPDWEQERRNSGDYGHITAYQERWCCAQGHTEIRPGVVWHQNGCAKVVLHCLRCGHQTGYPEERSPKAYPVETLPVVHDNRKRPGAHICERCGTQEAELHHWAPYHLFGIGCNEWPTSWLCRGCHRHWHRIVTPNMGRRAS